ncbi:MAG: hypothetical protein C4321_05785, partial [Chloroflexota bacterium]
LMREGYTLAQALSVVSSHAANPVAVWEAICKGWRPLHWLRRDDSTVPVMIRHHAGQYDAVTMYEFLHKDPSSFPRRPVYLGKDGFEGPDGTYEPL